jgi:hypothetical protein
LVRIAVRTSIIPTGICVVFLSPFRQILITVSRLRDDDFHLNPSQFLSSVTLPLNFVYYRRPSLTDQNVNVPSVRSYLALHCDSSVVGLTAYVGENGKLKAV